MSDIKSLYYEADTRKHQQAVMKWMGRVIEDLLERMLVHDASKFADDEAPYYIDPVYQLNTLGVPYGSDEYKRITKQMGKGWDHHKSVNDHHVEYFLPSADPFSKMNLLNLLEMVCDWMAASERIGNDPSLPLERSLAKFGMSEQLAMIIKNTINSLIEEQGDNK
jgi:hypothetical protein